MHRQIRALLDAGHEVTYVAPFTHFNVTPIPPITPIDVPYRGSGRSALRRGARGADLLVVHDLALLRALPFRHPPVVWDDREPAELGTLDRISRSRAQRRHHVLSSPEATLVSSSPPPPGDTRLVHIGRLSAERGVNELIGIAKRLVPHGIRLDLIGAADPSIRPLLRDAQRVGLLDWFGYVPNRHALRMAEGALAGLALACSEVEGTPTKVFDYMGRGLPVITTPQISSPVERIGCGIVVPLEVEAVVQAVLDLKEDPVRRAELGARGHLEASLHHHWPDHAPAFVAAMEECAEPSGVRGRRPHIRPDADRRGMVTRLPG